MVWGALEAALVFALLVRLPFSVLYQIEGKRGEHLFHIFIFLFSDVLSVAAQPLVPVRAHVSLHIDVVRRCQEYPALLRDSEFGPDLCGSPVSTIDSYSFVPRSPLI